MILKYSIKSINKHKIFSITLVIELICIFISLYNIIFYFEEIDRLSQKIDKINEKRVYRLAYDEAGTIAFSKGSSDLINMIKGLNNTNKYKYTIASPDNMIVEDFKDSSGFLAYKTEIELSNNGLKGIAAKSIMVNDMALEVFDLKLDEGRIFNSSEYYDSSESVLPVILGSDYSDIYSVGDSFIYLKGSELLQAEVIGILEKGESIPIKFDDSNAVRGADVNSNNYLLDKVIIVPLSENALFDQAQIYNLFYFNFIFIDKGMNTNERKDILINLEKKIEDDTGVHFSVKEHDKEIVAEVERYEEIKDNYVSTFRVSIIFATITIIVSIINMINYRKHEFGVYLFSGGTIKDVMKIIFTHMLSLMIISLVITCILLEFYFKFIQASIIQENGALRVIDFKIVGFLLIIGLIYIVVTSLIPINRLRNLSISELLR